VVNELAYSDLEIAPEGIVRQAARDFAAALSQMPEFKAFEQAATSFRRDESAQEAMRAYQEKQQSMRALQILGALSSEEQQELLTLQQAFYQHPVVQDYLRAQSRLATQCQQLGQLLSESLELDYAAACGVSCCG
jgi:cell fate (sporulation/competence/biofilm development) regulator YlbF (YheA/YmcA/DUF963 family)